MTLRRPQWLALGAALALLLTMYFGCPTQAPEMVRDAARRGLEVEATSPQALMKAARAELTPLARATLAALEEEYTITTEDSSRLRVLERLASEWYRADQPGLSGHYAQQIAELRDTVAEAWAIAGTTYSICVRQRPAGKEKEFCTQRAVKAYQAAISLAPNVVEHQLNLALTYTYNPPADNPMMGILRLRELQEKYPENTGVLLTLARLAIQTNQLDKAIERLNQAVILEPNNPEPVCLLATVQERKGDTTAATKSKARCQSLSSSR
ncbi:MAG: tetratricopeptide repeat protein [Bacteroidota bacterium]